MDEPTRTTCARCAVGCGLRTEPTEKPAREDRSLRVRGDPNHPVSEGLACRRGIEETAGSTAERLTEPLLRRNGELVAVGWDTALEKLGTRLREAIDRDPDGVGVIGSGQQTTEAAYLLGKVARGVLGTRNYDANTTLCMASAVTAYYGAFGSDAPPPTYDDIPDAETHVVWGANPAVAHPVLFSRIRRSAADGTLVVVDPVVTETAAEADRHVQVRAGEDLALARAVLASIVGSNRHDAEFIEANTGGFDRLRSALPAPATAAETAGVSRSEVDAIASAMDRRTLLYWGMGVNQSVRGTATARALVDLCLATGNLGPGSGPFSLTGQANSMGARLGASKGTWPGNRGFDDPAARRDVADRWGVPVDRLPEATGPGPVGIVSAVRSGAIETLWTVATNPAVGLPNAGEVREALDSVFLVVQDAFRSETVEYADLVLPAATWGETAGTLVSMDRSVSRVRPSRDPPGKARRDAEIISAVGESVRPGSVGTADPERVFEEFIGLTRDTPADCTHISHDALEREGAIRWPRTSARSGRYRYSRPGGSFRFPTPDGRARFSLDVPGSAPERPDDAYPLAATTARRSDAYNTAVRTRSGSKRLTVAVSPATHAAHRELIAGDTADVTEVVSRHGRSRARVAIDPDLPDGFVWLPIHAPATNVLTPDAVDPCSGEPGYKHCAVRFEAPE